MADPHSWRLHAACHGKLKIMLGDDVGVAKEVCAHCPVQLQCLTVALDEELPGVWGGMDHDERTRICPQCLGPKKASDLGCTPSHCYARLRRLMDLGGDKGTGIDVRVTLRGRPTARTDPYCPRPRGMSHASGWAYHEGCRCRASLDAKLNEEAEKERRDAAKATTRARRAG